MREVKFITYERARPRVLLFAECALWFTVFLHGMKVVLTFILLTSNIFIEVLSISVIGFLVYLLHRSVNWSRFVLIGAFLFELPITVSLLPTALATHWLWGILDFGRLFVMCVALFALFQKRSRVWFFERSHTLPVVTIPRILNIIGMLLVGAYALLTPVRIVGGVISCGIVLAALNLGFSSDDVWAAYRQTAYVIHQWQAIRANLRDSPEQYIKSNTGHLQVVDGHVYYYNERILGHFAPDFYQTWEYYLTNYSTHDISTMQGRVKVYLGDDYVEFDMATKQILYAKFYF